MSHSSWGGDGFTTSNAGTLTIPDDPNPVYSFSGTTATWTAPSISRNTGGFIFIKNRGTGNLTIQSAGSDTFWTTVSVISIVLAPGEARILVSDGVYWLVE